MLLGLADTPVEGPEQFPGQLRPVTVDTGGGGSVTFGPMTIKRPSVVRVYSPEPAKVSLLSRVLPVKVGTDGKSRIYGLPPTVAYTLALVIAAGGAYLAYQRLAGGGRGRGLLATNSPRRRRRGARRASRRKR